MEQPTDPATPEEFSNFFNERCLERCLIAEMVDLQRENAFWVEQARRRRDIAIQHRLIAIQNLDQARDQADLSEDDSPRYCFSPGY